MEQEDGYMVAMQMEMRHLGMRDGLKRRGEGEAGGDNGGRDKMLATVKLLRSAKVNANSCTIPATPLMLPNT